VKILGNQPKSAAFSQVKTGIGYFNPADISLCYSNPADFSQDFPDMESDLKFIYFIYLFIFLTL
jgi:hypothetical protein